MGQAFDPQVLLSEALMANLATLGDEGPRNAPAWFLWEGGAIWMPASGSNSSVRRLQADPRCAVEVTRFDNEAGILLHLGLRGRASIQVMDGARFRRLLSKYLGPEEARWNPWFIRNVAAIDDPDGRMIKLRPQTIFTNNVSYARSGPQLAWPPED
ncbi:pyridoxamine 5'-phosphate oxidase family protein [Paracoccus seriniphilus]|uniref:Pyridoxamine 5'-phosphate oxidase n=1 Tax=Paracoccus seriniphilus TaxID=184748 RepID=A0A239PZF3_9RHOB|nr:pyridoxamine 5'-phosphate oxidase family protein [Paracoccus seriniphilus]WCR14139.1 pyridoxamine 5'-phosphate oxidase family protein [Paracoccus seriniphilus]SNT75047.1 Pyridoxamine 5'-phosphate oxidase [Paracoccus seriniphilus]